MYPTPIGLLPTTGVNFIGLGLLCSGLLMGGLVLLRVAHFSRARRDS
jgi:hypothetical protein